MSKICEEGWDWRGAEGNLGDANGGDICDVIEGDAPMNAHRNGELGRDVR